MLCYCFVFCVWKMKSSFNSHTVLNYIHIFNFSMFSTIFIIIVVWIFSFSLVAFTISNSFQHAHNRANKRKSFYIQFLHFPSCNFNKEVRWWCDVFFFVSFYIQYCFGLLPFSFGECIKTNWRKKTATNSHTRNRRFEETKALEKILRKKATQQLFLYVDFIILSMCHLIKQKMNRQRTERNFAVNTLMVFLCLCVLWHY